jgi:hypothetical protein
VLRWRAEIPGDEVKDPVKNHCGRHLHFPDGRGRPITEEVIMRREVLLWPRSVDAMRSASLGARRGHQDELRTLPGWPRCRCSAAATTRSA